MPVDLLDPSLLSASRGAAVAFREAVKASRLSTSDLEVLGRYIRPFPHMSTLAEEFRVAAADAAAECSVLEANDVYVHLTVGSAAIFETCSSRQHKLSSLHVPHPSFSRFLLFEESRRSLLEAYLDLIKDMTGLPPREMLRQSDYRTVFAGGGSSLPSDAELQDQWAMAKASQVGTHAYQIQSLTRMGMAIRALRERPRYVLLNANLGYFLLGKLPYLPELLKRYLIHQAMAQETCVLSIAEQHQVPDGEELGQWASEHHGLNAYWFLRLPMSDLEEEVPARLQEKQLPPRLCVSYLFKLHDASFPMRLDVDRGWWDRYLRDNEEAERRLFAEVAYLSREVRRYGYPYPLYVAERNTQLSPRNRRTLRDIFQRLAQQEGITRQALRIAQPERVDEETLL